MPDVPRKIATVAEAAKLLRVHRITLYRMLKAGKVPGAFKIGRVWRVDLPELERFFRPGDRHTEHLIGSRVANC